jgi:hypothetical protein
MKRYLIALLVLTLAISEMVSAQGFKGGATLGLVGSQVAGDTYSGYNKAGVYVGGWVSYDVSKHSAFQMEMTYFQKGSRHNPDYEKNPADFPYLFRADYIEVPLLYLYKTGRFIIETGPSMGVLVHYYEESDQLPISDYDGYNRPARLSLQINLGMRFVINERFNAGIRTNNSLLNIRQNNVTGDVWRIFDHGQYHDALVIAAYYRF